ncbi:MAG: MerR family transcriptional regulator [Candidatus Marinimicrobia bacterium]|nr:MerR family transcriptional regulator [candidate division WOR-3 bacterium]MCK4447238.1 MerR family transcriptional regulator [Candidatus Neomarinimicrobiota bacterium]
MSEFNLTYSQLKEKAGVKNNPANPTDSTIRRWIQFGLIVHRKKFHSLYSNRSVEQLKLCMKLREYRKTIREMKLLFKRYSIEHLNQKLLRNISPSDLDKMINARK